MASSQSDQDMTVRVVTTVAALAAAFVVQRAMAAGWKAVTGHPAPGADDGEVGLGEVLTYAALTAGAVAVTRVFVTRRAARLVRRSA